MNLSEFAIAVGASPKWVQNAAAALGRPLDYGEAEALRLGLARMIHETVGTPLLRAHEIAGDALTTDGDGPRVLLESPDGSVQVTIDVARYRSTFGARLAVARREQPQRRGRPPHPSRGPIATAREYGIDISLLQSNLLRTPEERIRLAGANAEFIARIRGKAGR